ncbi:N-acetyl-gamma-glutamyl-phosphate reductase [Jeotgalibaca ciconiae]|uniref:N-acetyl-gamma-glutamyl-phosphate reductase n=1 Tax=Jeotgalibaca ciconiae TaxID=2496265 RepID=A0A3S9H8E3_9LACT|nr:N-acetyl-gamma-glutamyl-phosphate reductase [Jeotgalibaca ciconiae]AZP03622.1 N-acetyl-gamma-glutamyl-phosphate reductase [Jeotgalibaca ciconiae]HJB24188.1 N-acetyl-gamma-glutamyl-phosphate reductase [Candidatus Jeotgalibaca pullicola]
MVKVGILGASGYAGAELVRLLVQREDVEIIFVHSNNYAEIPFSKRYPHLKEVFDSEFSAMNFENNEYFDQVDVLFCALPHAKSQIAVKSALEKGLKVIDLSADFRLKDAEVYEEWYQTKHQVSEALAQAVYGIPEINREAIKDTNLLANPGCYPTSIILGLYPLLKEGYTTNETIISDSKSGISGAGRGLKDGNLFTQATETIQPYAVGSHRHTPEIEEQLSSISGEKTSLMFVPHLAPMQRGILSTIYIKNERNLSEDQLLALYNQYYEEEKFVRVLEKGETPTTKAVSGSNYCDIGLAVDTQSNMIVIMSVIDNLIKGASGQAIQNMNLMLGLDETTGLTQAPIWP